MSQIYTIFQQKEIEMRFNLMANDLFPFILHMVCLLFNQNVLKDY